MSLYEFVDELGRVIRSGRLRAVGGTVGDVPTQQADHSLSQAAGGGSPPAVELHHISFDDMAVSAQQQILALSITGGTPASGDFTLDFDGTSVGPIDFNAAVSDVQDALDLALGGGQATASGSALPAGTVTLTLVQDFLVEAATVSASTLNAGTAHVVQTQAAIVAGGRAVVRVLVANEAVLGGVAVYTEAFNDSANPSSRFVGSINAIARVALIEDNVPPSPVVQDGFLNLPASQASGATAWLVPATWPQSIYVLMQPFNGDGTTGGIDVYLLVTTVSS